MKEYGGYIELETNHGKEYYENLVRLNCGRACLAYLIESQKIRKILLPFFVCNAVRQTCEKYGVEYESYFIDENFFPKFNGNLNNDEVYIYVVNHYSQLDKQYLVKLKEKYHNIIIDNVCAFFEEPISGCDTIYSCRKYFGVPDGAYLSTNATVQKKYPVDISYGRMYFLLGRFEKTASEFYTEYVRNNELFRNEPIKNMSKLTLNLLKGIDYELVKEKRGRNFQYLHKRLGNRNNLTLKTTVGPYAYPFMVENGHVLRQKLQENKIYIPMLWPEVLKLVPENTLEYKFANDILPLPVDQRYGKEDMEYICDIIERSGIC